MTSAWFEVVQQFDWRGTLKVVLASSVVSSLVTIGWNSYRDRRDHRRERRDAALEVALSLEKYARNCRAMMHKADWASEEAIRTRSSEPRNGVHVPDFSFPRIEWKWLNYRITSVLREFPATVHYAREFVSSRWEYAQSPEVCEDVEFECAKLAKQALILARLTRKKQGAARWNPGAASADLERELDGLIDMREERRKKMLKEKKFWLTPASASLAAAHTSQGSV